MKKIFGSIMLIMMFVAVKSGVFAHCEIPCGIYDDEMRFDMLSEHIDTMEKSIKSISDLEKHKKKNYNQIVRWVNNKDRHADEFSDILCFYFLNQRISPVDNANAKEYAEYTGKLALIHSMVFNAMKAKQTTDLKYIEILRKDLASFKRKYEASE